MIAANPRDIVLPHLYEPRDYQINELWEPFDLGFNRIIQVWHRRSGKDKTDVNLVAREMHENVGTYYYFYPTYSQGKKALWEGRGKDGVAYLDHFPAALIESINHTEMKIRYKNGSIFQIIGVENVDSVLGTNPRGCVFSEYSLQNPKAWDFIRPILAENGGWAIFNYTPRGRNHGYKLVEMAKKNPKWHVSILSVDDTNVLTAEDIEEERLSGMDEDMIQQEYYCSFVAAIQGSVYWRQVQEAVGNGQFKEVPYDPKMLVHTVWDLGKRDTNVIGFYQSNGLTVRKIRTLSGSKKGLLEWIKEVKELPYVYGKHFAPHDIEVSDYSLNGEQSRKDLAREHGIEFEVIPGVSLEEGIDAGRRFFKRLYVDEHNNADFIEAIPQYAYKYDEVRKVFTRVPDHDWSSHYADEHRYAALVYPQFTNEHDTIRAAQVETNRAERRELAKDTGV